MLISIAAICGGLALLTYGADRFIDGAAATAFHFGIPPLLVGLVVVGFATSAPEMLVSAMAAFNGNPSLAIGNAIGSNIANVGLVLGVTALMAPLVVRSAVLRREFPMMFVALLLASALLVDTELDRRDGAILLAAMFVSIGMLAWLGMRAPKSDPMVAEITREIDTDLTLGRSLFWLAVGLILLMGGSKLLVDGAVEIARFLGVSDVIIGLTIVAVGTSLPELAASIASALKDEPDIALGNVIGSNMFNSLGVLSMPGLIAPAIFDSAVARRDIPYMLIICFILFVLSWSFKQEGRLSRFGGSLLLAGFIVYQVLLFAES
ncbi:MAG: calcium/sodium antiporter [Gammaproteobacteria bacterium]